MDIFSLENKVAVVTGSAQGMGKAIAKLLAGRGAKVALLDVLGDEIKAVVDEITGDGGRASSWEIDVSDRASVDRVFGEVSEKFGRIDILINNAGVFDPKPIWELEEDEWDKTININLKGQFLCAKRAALEMKKNNWGRIVNIASVASGQLGIGISGGSHYTSSKGGVLGLTETLAIELAPEGINVNAVSPGVIDTKMVDEAGFTDEAMAELLNGVPLKRKGTPEDIAYPVLFLASEESAYITGANLVVDGGWLAS